MRWLKAIVAEIFGLFVDDGAFALAIIVWLGAVWLLLPRLSVPTAWGGIILFAGLALILVESATRRSRR
ncbi:MAG TPA: hypothetical protein VHX61_01350 [Rhizomicrobium sp.]|jgi:hypothetical protein|nr:hypothetical protein [Rhizomicrobium sp.]